MRDFTAAFPDQHYEFQDIIAEGGQGGYQGHLFQNHAEAAGTVFLRAVA